MHALLTGSGRHVFWRWSPTMGTFRYSELDYSLDAIYVSAIDRVRSPLNSIGRYLGINIVRGGASHDAAIFYECGVIRLRHHPPGDGTGLDAYEGFAGDGEVECEGRQGGDCRCARA